MSKDTGVTSAHQTIPSIMLLPSQVARLKKEEDEEQWISGEELCTEGSSDEENCKCKPLLTDTLNKSYLMPIKHYPSKSKVVKKTKTNQLQETLTEDKSSLSIQSTSKDQYSSESNLGGEEEEYIADDEISWKVNREGFSVEDEILALKEYEEEFPELSNSIDNIFEDYLNTLTSLEETENENFAKQNDKIKDEVKNTIEFLDKAVNNLYHEIEHIKQKTKKTQLQNRLRLKEIICKGPPMSKKLATNTASFLQLCSDSEITNLSDITSYKALQH